MNLEECFREYHDYLLKVESLLPFIECEIDKTDCPDRAEKFYFMLNLIGDYQTKLEESLKQI